MKKRIGILTSGGDCPGLNAAIRGMAKAAYNELDVEIIGIKDGYKGLIYGDYQLMKKEDFSGILTLGGTILGTARTPFKNMRLIEEDNLDKVAAMKANYKKMGLDCLVCLGGNGTHKTANLLSNEGLNIIGLPKTIDNDIYGTDFTFGFHSALDIVTDVIDRLHSTAASHGRCMVVEVMGNKAGWLTLYSGIAGGADVIIIPEVPYNMDSVANVIKTRANENKGFSIIAVAEGAFEAKELDMSKKERQAYKLKYKPFGIAQYIATSLSSSLGVEARAVVPGHIQRGGSPSAYDRVLSTMFGSYAAKLIKKEIYGVSVALVDGKVKHNKLCDIAGKPNRVPTNHELIKVAKSMGIIMGD